MGGQFEPTELGPDEILWDGQRVRLHGDHFVANIALPAEETSGIWRVKRDPRRFRLKPAAYLGVVEKAAKGCRLVQIGATVVIERWTYEQEDLDDERMIARERQLLIVNDTTPAPKVVVLQLLDEAKPATALALPQTLEKVPPRTHCGRVYASADPAHQPGELLWVERAEEGQFRYGENLLAFRNNGRAFVLMKGWSKEHQQARRRQMNLSAEEFAVVMDKVGFQSI